MIYIILILVIIILIAEKCIDKKEIQTEDKKEDFSNYTKKEYLLTQSELKFYKILKQITNELDLSLFCQVAMYELINCNDYKEFNRIRSKSIDFVITEKNCKIKLCIELDDPSHKEEKRKNRDNLVNEIFKKTDTKLLRINTQNYYNIEEIKKQIEELL